MTSLLDGLLAVVVAFALNAFIVSRFRAHLPEAERRFVATVYTRTLLLRCLIAVLLNVYATNSYYAATFWGDSGTYDYGGSLLAARWGGSAVQDFRVSRSISGYGFYYVVGVIYYVFGHNQLLVQFVNSTIGSLSVVLIFLIARLLFDSVVARQAALFAAYFPAMIFWSCAMYKDPAILFCIALIMYCVLRLRERFTLLYVALYVGATLALMTLRFYVFYMPTFATLGTFVFVQRRGLLGGLMAQATLGGALILAMYLGVRGEQLTEQQSYMTWERLQITRSGQAALAQSAYGTEFQVRSPEGALSALPKGLLFLFFAPFPWSLTGLRQILTLPEMLVWYALMPALLRGLRYTLRKRFFHALPILVYSLILTVAYAVFQTNVGTAYRQRTQVTMFFFIFMGVGIVEKRRARERAAPAYAYPVRLR